MLRKAKRAVAKNYIAAAKPRSDWWIWWKYLPNVEAVEYPEGSDRFVQAFYRADELYDLPGMYRVFGSGELELLALLSRETKVPPESIPYREEGGFYAAAKTVSDRFYRPDSPSG